MDVILSQDMAKASASPFASIPPDHFIHRTKRFPILLDTKRPAFAGWQKTATNDPAQIATWAAEYPGCAWAIAYAEGGRILVESDPKALKDSKKKDGERAGDERADAELAKLFASWELPTGLTPHFRSRSGGKHFVFRVPDTIDLKEPFTPGTSAPPYRYTQGGLAKVEGFAQDCVETKINGFGLIPPSSFKGRAYELWPGGPHQEYPAPPGLIEAIDRRSAGYTTSAFVVSNGGEIKAGRFDLQQLVKKILRVNHTVGMDYPTWRNLLWSLLAEYGPHVASQIGALIHDGAKGTDDLLVSIVGSGAKDYRPGHAKLESFFKYAADHGDKGSVRPPTSTMFGGPPVLPDIDAILAEIDAEAAAPLISAPSIVPMIGGRGEAQAKAWAPILASVPMLPRTEAHPELPDTGHPLRDAINAAIPGIIATGNADALAVIEATHPDTAAKVGAITATIMARAEALRQDAEHALISDYVRVPQGGRIEHDNPDNVRFFLASLRIEVRYNEWTEKVELRGWEWPSWTDLDDKSVDQLLTRAAQSGTRFNPGIDFFWRTLRAFAYKNPQDPARDLLDQLEKGWDGNARLHSWLSHACGVPYDDYHQAVGATILLGMVARVRRPGIKFDLMPVFVSAQGMQKSTLARMLALNNDWFVENVPLGESAKELILILKGKTVVEITEMKSRSEAKAAKAMLSATHDEARTAYGRMPVRRARRNIFIGTTNEPEFLEDQTGGRRFLPIVLKREIDTEFVRTFLPQLMGEAAALESRGAEIGLPRKLWATAAVHQEAATTQSSAEVLLQDWFGGADPCWVTSANLVLLLRQALNRDINKGVYAPVMAKLGFESKTERRGAGGKPIRCWVRGDPILTAPGYDLRLSPMTGRPSLTSASLVTQT